MIRKKTGKPHRKAKAKPFTPPKPKDNWTAKTATTSAPTLDDVKKAMSTIVDYVTQEKHDVMSFGGTRGKFGRLTPVLVCAVGKSAIPLVNAIQQTVETTLNNELGL